MLNDDARDPFGNQYGVHGVQYIYVYRTVWGSDKQCCINTKYFIPAMYISTL